MRQLLGRIGTAWRILIGREPTWWGIQAEWAEIKVEAADLFQKHNTLASRLMKSQKELRAAQDEQLAEREQPDLFPDGGRSLAERKQDLRARIYARRAGGSPQPSETGGD